MGIRTRYLVPTHTSHQIRTRYQQVVRGVRMPADRPVTFRERLDAVTLLYPEAVFCGWTAAALHAVAYRSGRPIEVWLPARHRRQGVVIRGGALPDGDVLTRGGIRCTTAVRALIDIARFTDGDDAIVGLDQCLRGTRSDPAATTREEALRYLDEHPHLHRSRRVRAALAQADGRAESPPETRTRLLLHRAGLTMFIPQVEIDGGRYRLDLGAPEYRVAVEYDGRDHADPGQQSLDSARRNALCHDYGWEVVTVTAGILSGGREHLLRQVRSALAARNWTAA